MNKLIAFTLVSLSTYTAYGIFPTNFFRPYDLNITRFCPPYPENKISFGVAGEFGIDTIGRDQCGEKVNPFAIWQCTQSTLAMIKGFDLESPCEADRRIAELAQCLVDVVDDGTRGHIELRGNLELDHNMMFSMHYHASEIFSLGFYLSHLAMHTSGVTCTDLTQDVTDDDLLVKEKITDDLKKNVRELGCLHLGEWQESGIGDFTVMAHLHKNFPQARPALKNVRVMARAGLSAPTGEKEDPNRLFSVPFGNCGHWAIPFGAGLDLTLHRRFAVGIDAQFLYLFGRTQKRRIKTELSQDDLLNLKVTDVFEDFGFTQRYNLYAELHRLFGGLSIRGTFQHWRHNADKLTVCCDNFSSRTANTSERVFDDWTINQFIVSAYYDFSDITDYQRVAPYIQFFYKHPFGGKRTVQFETVGFAFGISY